MPNVKKGKPVQWIIKMMFKYPFKTYAHKNLQPNFSAFPQIKSANV